MKIIEKFSELDGEILKIRKKPIELKAKELKERVRIYTREGDLVGEIGDFIIEGIEGEIYPIGREIFFKTYDKVD